MTFPLELLVLVLLIGCNAVLATGELALISARRARLATLEARGSRGATQARLLADEPSIFLPTLQAGLTLIGIVIGVTGGPRLAQFLRPLIALLPLPQAWITDLAVTLSVLLVTFLTLVFGELVPKQIALRHPEPVAVALAGPIAMLARVGAPVVWLLGASSTLVLKVLGVTGVLREAVTEEDLKAVLAEGAEVGVLETGEREMIERLLRLADKPVRAIMTARTELVWIDRTAPRHEIVRTLTGSPHSRFVVCDGAVDNVVGVIQAKDLLDRILSGGDLSLGAALRQPTVVPDTVTALDALERLKNDVLGAIIGEAGDPAQILAGDAPETEYAFDGLMSADEVQARLHLPTLPSGSFHTLGGLVLALLRRVPKTGDRIVFGGWRFEVTEMDGRRVATVRLTRETLAEESGGGSP